MLTQNTVAAALQAAVIAGVAAAAQDRATPEIPPAADNPVTLQEVAAKVVETPAFRKAVVIAEGAPKPWWQSTGLWGVIVSAGFKALAIAVPGAVDPGMEADVLQLVLLGVSFVGDAVAAVGRWKASRPLSTGAA